MKKLIFTTLCMGASFFLSAQEQNILPEKGNVGIGTLKPKAKLDVNGNVQIDSNLVVNDSLIIGKSAVINGKLVTSSLKIKGLDELNQTNGTDRFLVIDENGDIRKIRGPKVDIKPFELKLCKTNNNGDVINPFWDNGINKLFVGCPEVNVGINTEAPRTKLDVIGGIHGLRLSLGNNADPANMGTKVFHLKSTSTTPQNKIFSITRLNDTEIFSLQNNGLMIINSGLDQYANSKIMVIQNNDRKILELNNNGLLRAREVLVDLTNWPDYVFGHDYKLRSLEELDAYIKLQHHLPDVPSAEIIHNEGVNLGEMDKVLMQKVEELTLYVLQLHKENINLNQEVQQLKNLLLEIKK